MEQIVDAVRGLPTLDASVPLMLEQPVGVLQFFDALSTVAEQVIDVPKIIFEDIPTRIFREPQLAEQLVEVPTVLYFLKQKVGIPVSGGGGRLADHQGFLKQHPEYALAVTFRPGHTSFVIFSTRTETNSPSKREATR